MAELVCATMNNKTAVYFVFFFWSSILNVCTIAVLGYYTANIQLTVSLSLIVTLKVSAILVFFFFLTVGYIKILDLLN